MDTDLLKTFLEVQRTRHFGKAAENLYLTQSAVSFRIRQLEQQLGVNLFIRHRNNIQLTSAGERLLPHAQTMLAALQKARQDVANSVNEPCYFQLGVAPLFVNSLLAVPLRALQQALPELNLRIDSLSREHLSQQLLSQQLDLALLTEPAKTDELYVVAQGQVTLLAVCQSSAVVDELAYCHLDWGNHPGHPSANRTTLRTNSCELALDAVLHQGVYSYLPAPILQPYLRSKQLQPMPQLPSLVLPYYLLCHRERREDNLIKQISQQLLTLGAE